MLTIGQFLGRQKFKVVDQNQNNSNPEKSIRTICLLSGSGYPNLDKSLDYSDKIDPY